MHLYHFVSSWMSLFIYLFICKSSGVWLVFVVGSGRFVLFFFFFLDSLLDFFSFGFFIAPTDRIILQTIKSGDCLLWFLQCLAVHLHSLNPFIYYCLLVLLIAFGKTRKHQFCQKIFFIIIDKHIPCKACLLLVSFPLPLSFLISVSAYHCFSKPISEKKAITVVTDWLV